MNLSSQTFLNRDLDRIPRTELRLLRRHLPAFQVCGYAGLLFGFVQSLVLIRCLHLSQLVLLGITGVVILTFYGLAMATKILTGKEQIIYYHQEIAVLAMIALFLCLTHEPILSYLDVAILGIGLFLAFGRVGCLMVGCCHGRPSKLGVCYRAAHAEAGFPRSLVNVRLFPVQALESIFVLCVVLLGDTLLVRGQQPGEALELYTVVYGCGRFYFEFLRGDVDRPYTWGFSQAQWISLLLITGMLWAEVRGTLPFHASHFFGFAGLVLTVLVIAVSRRLQNTPLHVLLHPHHVLEIASALRYLGVCCRQPNHDLGSRPEVVQTSAGLRISAGEIIKWRQSVRHYSLSKAAGTLDFRAARALGNEIALLEHDLPFELIPGKAGVFHLLLRPTVEIPLSHDGQSAVSKGGE